jgi:hypothetical protein
MKKTSKAIIELSDPKTEAKNRFKRSSFASKKQTISITAGIKQIFFFAYYFLREPFEECRFRAQGK